MVHPCDKPCGNKTASGYCATTACINPQYSNIGTAQYGQGVQKRIVTKADKIRAMTDEELAVLLEGCICPKGPCPDIDRDTPTDKKRCTRCWLNWLKQEVSDNG